MADEQQQEIGLLQVHFNHGTLVAECAIPAVAMVLLCVVFEQYCKRDTAVGNRRCVAEAASTVGE